MAKVLIVGASRGIGLETVKRALDAGHSVRAMARSARRIPVRHADLETFDGDVLDRAAVDRALEGVDAVVQTLGISMGPQTMLRPVRFFSDATRTLVAAMEAVGVKRLIAVTGFGAGDSRGRGGCLYDAGFRFVLGRAYADKDVQEQIIRRSRLDWVIARPVILTNGTRTGSYKALTDAREWRPGFISRADVADFLVRQIDDDSYLGETPVLIG